MSWSKSNHLYLKKKKKEEAPSPLFSAQQNKAFHSLTLLLEPFLFTINTTCKIFGNGDQSTWQQNKQSMPRMEET